MSQVNFNRNLFATLKEKYNHAVENKIEVFEFEGQEVLTSYARYLIEYLETIFGSEP